MFKMVFLPYGEPPAPADGGHGDKLRRAVIVSVLSVIGIPYMIYLMIFRRSTIAPVLAAAKAESIKLDPVFKDMTRLQRVWISTVGQRYLQGPLEYQRREGFCSSATLRNVLKSLNASALPPAKSGASTPTKYVAALDAHGHTTSTIVYGSDGYDAFLAAIKHANSDQYRVAVNFLRSPLFGFASPMYAPFNFLLGIFGGHFSVVIGYLEEDDLVAVFDVNHSYGPYLVESKRLFRAVNSFDRMTSKSRAVIVSRVVS
ncbi:hypothetical protein ACHHYP_05392 [Achlya hypogyna]|uniref:glutathione gamma-glutamylcysteinyltransferase n=1 Tax=Achlya hypogyna TaxID=1202772 RepID=A0A1V9YY65_ACHHY|nr:hypothetical protein ACHHYP_05392 [Achlya hypogyna]